MITTIVFAVMRVILGFSVWFWFLDVIDIPPILPSGVAGFSVGILWGIAPFAAAWYATRFLLPNELETLTMEGVKG